MKIFFNAADHQYEYLVFFWSARTENTDRVRWWGLLGPSSSIRPPMEQLAELIDIDIAGGVDIVGDQREALQVSVSLGWPVCGRSLLQGPVSDRGTTNQLADCDGAQQRHTTKVRPHLRHASPNPTQTKSVPVPVHVRLQVRNFAGASLQPGHLSAMHRAREGCTL